MQMAGKMTSHYNRLAPLNATKAVPGKLIVALAMVMFCASSLRTADAHGMLTWPASRNWAAHLKGDETCPHCKNDHGLNPPFVYPETEESSVRHSLCGDAQGGYMTVGEPQMTYKSGETVFFEAVVTAHHMGHLEFRLCEDGDAFSQTCLNQHSLLRASSAEAGEAWVDEISPIDTENPERYYVPPFECTNCGCPATGTSRSAVVTPMSAGVKNANSKDWDDDESYPVYPAVTKLDSGRRHLRQYVEGNTCDTCFKSCESPGITVGMVYRMAYKLPAGVTCDNCVLQWYYATANSCNYPGYGGATWPHEPFAFYSAHPDWWQSSLGECKIDGGTPEEFWNCADIKIVPDDGLPPTAPAPTAPTPAALTTPTPAPDWTTPTAWGGVPTNELITAPTPAAPAPVPTAASGGGGAGGIQDGECLCKALTGQVTDAWCTGGGGRCAEMANNFPGFCSATCAGAKSAQKSADEGCAPVESATGLTPLVIQCGRCLEAHAYWPCDETPPACSPGCFPQK